MTIYTQKLAVYLCINNKNAICFDVTNPNALHSHIVGALEAGKMLQVQHLHFLYFAFFSMGVGDGVGGVERETS